MVILYGRYDIFLNHHDNMVPSFVAFYTINVY